MSHNAKNSRRIHAAREMSKTRLNGGSGPSQTQPKHGKKNAWWQKFKSYKEFISGGGKQKRERKPDLELVEVTEVIV